MMTDWPQALDQYVSVTKTEQEHTAALNAILITCKRGGETGFQRLIEDMGPYLTTTDGQIRSRAVQLIGEVIGRLPDLKLHPSAVGSVAEFLSERLSDDPTVSAAISAVAKLLARHPVPAGVDIRVIRALFADVQLQAKPQPTRLAALEMLLNVAEKMTAIGREFSYGALQAVDGERDPRNLKISFHLMCKVVKLMPEAEQFAEDIFDVVSCYFPITFSPPPNDVNGVTRADLVNGLRDAIAAAPYMAEWAIPFFLERLPSDKQDALENLAYCLPFYNAQVVAPFVGELWPALRTEIFAGQDKPIVDAALSCLKSLVTVLSPAAGVMQQCLQGVVGETAFRLPAGAAADAAMQILLTLLEASADAAKYILEIVVPQLLSNEQRAASLPVLANFVHSCVGLRSGAQLLGPYARALLACFVSGMDLAEETARDAAADGACELILVPQLLSADNAPIAAVVAKLAQAACAAGVGTRASNAFIRLTMQRQQEIAAAADVCRSAIVQQPKTALAVVAAACAVSQPLFLTMVPVFQEQLLSRELSADSALWLDALASMVVSAEKAKLLVELLATLLPRVDYTVAMLVASCALLLRNVMRQLESEGQISFMATLHSLNVLQLVPSPAMCTAALGSLRPASLSSPHAAPLAAELIHFTTNSSEWTLLQNQCAEAAASVINKLPAGYELDSFVASHVYAPLFGRVHDDEVPVAQRASTVRMIGWVAKAMTCRGHEDTEKLLHFVAGALGNPAEALAAAAASAIGDIVRDSDGPLSKPSHATVRPLYKQRTTAQLLPIILDAYRTGQWQGQCAAAVAHILRNAPRAALKDQLASLLPLLGSAMRQAGAEAGAAAADALTELVDDPACAVGAHLTELLPALLHLSVNGSLSAARISALQCISAFSKLPFPLLFPHKQEVLNTLAKPLDDRKRTVRRAAALCRSRWFMLSS
eukprot:TRINITY_DN8732_c0_g1_i1.p1 TRINITY_DN8732_c0_g1~~TRINITY_DN8732_c0_g1_i1.p1  ORF type:complete len:939 (+),score=264.47 TRINITY_DN8732_c0_g1_i1:88-2904(+)